MRSAGPNQRIGATARKGQTLHESVNRGLMDEKHMTTWATVDRFIHLVSRGSVEDLQVHVSRPKEFIENRKQTSFVVLDATALWLKLRGEDKVFVSEGERTSQQQRKAMGKAFKKLNKRDPEAIEAFEQLKASFHDASEDNAPMVEAAYSSAGDKYRLTLINISGVENWFDPSETPRAVKKKSILLVPSAKHIKIRDIDLETRLFKRSVEYKTSTGDEVKYEEGQPVGNLLAGWISGLLEFEPVERERILSHLEIWGQPRAWMDEKVSCDMVDFVDDLVGLRYGVASVHTRFGHGPTVSETNIKVEEEYGQSVVMADCLASQWTEAVLLRAWLRNIMWVPYAPEVTSTLQEPDTHEHSQLKALIRQVKSELHWALESEWYEACKVSVF